MKTAADIQQALIVNIGAEISARDGLTGVNAVVPQYYPDGERCALIFERDGRTSRLRITDGGGAYERAWGQTSDKSLEKALVSACHAMNVETDGVEVYSIVVAPTSRQLAAAAIAVAEASTSAAHIALNAGPPKLKKTRRNDAASVAKPYVEQRIGLTGPRQPYAGVSGQPWVPTFNVPEKHILLYLVTPKKSAERAASVRGQISDIAPTNGYRFGAIVDDRDQEDEAMMIEQRRILGDYAALYPLKHPDEWSALAAVRPPGAGGEDTADDDSDENDDAPAG